MEERKASSITKEELEENGWSINESNFPFVCKKQLGESNLYMVVHMYYNEPVFALHIPDAGLLNIDVGNIEDLNTFEQAIISFDYNY